MTSDEIDTWARGFIEATSGGPIRDTEDPLWRYIGGLSPQMSESVGSDNIWAIIRAVVALKPTQSVLGILAAGPLEDLIHYHGAEFIERIEAEAQTSPAFRHLLGGVWESGPSDIWKRVETARAGTAW
jgi:hypothetical protein